MGFESRNADGTTSRQSRESKRQREPTRWFGNSEPMQATLPNELRETVEGFLGTTGLETLAVMVDALRRQTGTGSLDTGDLCYASTETEHWGVVDGETHHFQCFYDALVLAEIVESSVEIRTKSPEGTVVRAGRTESGEMTTEPSDAVMSFGIDQATPRHSSEGPAVEQLYAVICPYVKAFPSWVAYDDWSESTDGVTVGMPLADGTCIARRLVRRGMNDV